MKPTQREWVIAQLKERGEITRNECLRNYISRLGAIIQVLEQQGWSFITESREGDYVYKVAEKPKVKVISYEPVIENGRAVAMRKTVTIV